MSWQSEDERELISRLQKVSPSPQTTARLRSRILTEVAAGASVGASSAAAATVTTARSIGVGVKIALVVTGGALLIAAGVVLGSRSSTHPRPPPQVPSFSAAVAHPVELGPTATAPVSTPPALTASARSHAAPSDLAEELKLLGQAQTAMSAGDFARALTVLDSHRQRFPRGALASERAGLRVVALCRSGAVEVGRTEARRLLSASPGSTLAARIRAACGL